MTARCVPRLAYSYDVLTRPRDRTDAPDFFDAARDDREVSKSVSRNFGIYTLIIFFLTLI